MKNIIAIRREDLSKKGEKRVAISPALAKEIVSEGYSLLVQPAFHPDTQTQKRAYSDEAYAEAGAKITEDISEANIVFGLKEIELANILPNKAYFFFSHTHKGQVKNRKMLQACVDRKVSIVDYELIVNEHRQRVITAFTYFAGYAGMIDSIWALGKRFQFKGMEHPFSQIPQSIEKEDLPLIRKNDQRSRGGDSNERYTS